MSVLDISFGYGSTIYRLNFGTVLTVVDYFVFYFIQTFWF